MHDELSTDYTVERHAFPGYNSQKVKTFRGLYRRKAWLLRGIIRGKACNRELFCIKAGFFMLKSMESFLFLHTILQKGIPFRRIIRGKSKLPAYHTAESMPFRRIIHGKSKLSVNYPAECFSIPWKSKSHF